MSEHLIASTTQDRQKGGFLQGIPGTSATPSIQQGGCCGSSGSSGGAGCCGEPIAQASVSTGAGNAQGCCGEPQDTTLAVSNGCCGEPQTSPTQTMSTATRRCC